MFNEHKRSDQEIVDGFLSSVLEKDRRAAAIFKNEMDSRGIALQNYTLTGVFVKESAGVIMGLESTIVAKGGKLDVYA